MELVLFASGVVMMTDTVIPANNNAGQSPLPAFFYGGGGPGPADASDASATRQSVPIDRRTLLGLVAGTGMLASVLFAGGILIGASMFMSAPRETAFAETRAAPVFKEVSAEVLIAPPGIPAGNPREEGTPVPASEPESKAVIADDAARNMTQTAPSDETAVGSEELAPAGREVVSTPAPPASGPPGPVETEMAALTREVPTIKSPKLIETPAAPAPQPRTTRSGEIPLPPPVPPAKSVPFAVQIGAFRVRENANTELRRLAGKGLDPLVVRRTSSDGNVWFYVRVGAYEDRARAKAAADRLKETNAIIGFPVRAEPGEVVLE